MLTRRGAEVEIKVPVAANDYVVDHDLEACDKETPNIDDAKDYISGQENKIKYGSLSEFVFI